ncbi:MAG: methylmalonyl Co-A mutase-associated GTPase MeaB [Deltaproteobacteria bacterium]|nr:methylmalonyl Co-A mutase-associated GTPase MeaB [Deltaproteobacteria bacterium]
MQNLIQKKLSGDRVALSRLMSYIENRPEQVSAILASIHQFLGRAEVIGITGPPGAGKSTLVDQMIAHYRALGKKVGVVAVDPSSPFTGGALLGDRVRMMDHAEDEGVFIRSLGSRGALGGLSRATRNIVRLMDAFGYEVVIVETVGVGQTEMDVLEVAHTTVVVLTPESGDTIQTLKAGLLEAADVFAINKSDRDGAHKIYQELLSMIEMGSSTKPKVQGWKIPVLQIQALKNIGISELRQQIDEHYQQVIQSPLFQQKLQKIRLLEWEEGLRELLHHRLQKILKEDSGLAQLKSEVEQGAKNPFENLMELEKKIQISVG